MKKLIIAALVAVAITSSAFAAPETVSYKVQNHFKADFADAENVSWKIDKDYIKVSFVIDEEKMEAFYNNDGDLLATSKAIAFNKLPKKAITAISTKYPFPPYELGECVELTNADGDTNYYVGFSTAKEKVVLEVSKSGSISEFKRTAIK